jgi:hypothetical protein
MDQVKSAVSTIFALMAGLLTLGAGYDILVTGTWPIRTLLELVVIWACGTAISAVGTAAFRQSHIFRAAQN